MMFCGGQRFDGVLCLDKPESFASKDRSLVVRTGGSSGVSIEIIPGRGGRHYSYLFSGAENTYESVAVGVGSCGPHVDFFNDDVAPGL